MTSAGFKECVAMIYIVFEYAGYNSYRGRILQGITVQRFIIIGYV